MTKIYVRTSTRLSVVTALARRAIQQPSKDNGIIGIKLLEQAITLGYSTGHVS